MYTQYTPDDWRTHLGLRNTYTIDGILVFGSYQKSLYTMVEDTVHNSGLHAEFNTLSDEFLSPILEINIDNKHYWFMTAYGTALLSEILHIGCLLGSKKNIIMGTCSGLKDNMSSLDFIIPTYSYAEETSATGYAHHGNHKFVANKELSERLYIEMSKDHIVHKAPTMTNQAMLNQTTQQLQSWANQGYAGVEMETATVFAVSQFFKVPAAAILRIGDTALGKDSAETIGYQKARQLRHKVSQEALTVALKELFQ